MLNEWENWVRGRLRSRGKCNCWLVGFFIFLGELGRQFEVKFLMAVCRQGQFFPRILNSMLEDYNFLVIAKNIQD